jgi:hypothetical protein
MNIPLHIIRRNRLTPVQILPSDYTEWNASTVTNNTPTSDGDFFWENPLAVGLRASLHYNTGSYSLVSGDFKFYIHPRTPSAGSGLYNYRAEVARRSTVTIPVASRELLGCTYVVPDAGLKPRDTGFGIGQWHTGTGVGGPYPANSPCIYLEVAIAGVADKNGDISQQNELVVVNKVKGFTDGNNGRVNTGIIFSAGAVIHLEQDYTSGLGVAGKYKLRVRVGSGSWSTVYEQNEPTIWSADADGGSKSNVHPYWKLGVYAFGLVSGSGVTATEALNGGTGTYDIEMRIRGKIKTAVLLAADPQYASVDAINAVDTSVS